MAISYVHRDTIRLLMMMILLGAIVPAVNCTSIQYFFYKKNIVLYFRY